MDKVHTRSVVDLLTSRDKGLNIEYDTSVIVKKYQIFFTSHHGPPSSINMLRLCLVSVSIGVRREMLCCWENFNGSSMIFRNF